MEYGGKAEREEGRKGRKRSKRMEDRGRYRDGRKTRGLKRGKKEEG